MLSNYLSSHILILTIRKLSFGLQSSHNPKCKELQNKDHATCRKERFIGSLCWLPGSECSSSARMGRGALWEGPHCEGGRVFLPENSRSAGFRLFVITRWNGSTCLASWETGSFWGFASRETSRGVLQVS
jgi:hypothetical protein